MASHGWDHTSDPTPTSKEDFFENLGKEMNFVLTHDIPPKGQEEDDFSDAQMFALQSEDFRGEHFFKVKLFNEIDSSPEKVGKTPDQIGHVRGMFGAVEAYGTMLFSLEVDFRVRRSTFSEANHGVRYQFDTYVTLSSGETIMATQQLSRTERVRHGRNLETFRRLTYGTGFVIRLLDG